MGHPFLVCLLLADCGGHSEGISPYDVWHGHLLVAGVAIPALAGEGRGSSVSSWRYRFSAGRLLKLLPPWILVFGSLPRARMS